jgi:hypothetical protein
MRVFEERFLANSDPHYSKANKNVLPIVLKLEIPAFGLESGKKLKNFRKNPEVGRLAKFGKSAFTKTIDQN